jgi:hypothetical protein
MFKHVKTQKTPFNALFECILSIYEKNNEEQMTQKYTKMLLHVATWVHIRAAYENKLASPTIAESTS